MRYLALLILVAALLSTACTPATAPGLPTLAALTVAGEPQQPHEPPAQPRTVPTVAIRRIPDGLAIDAAVWPSVADRWYALAYIYPDVAKPIRRIVARKAGIHGWPISYERTTIYVNTQAGEYVVVDAITEQFARRAFALMQRQHPATARSFRTWKRFAVWLTAGVR